MGIKKMGKVSQAIQSRRNQMKETMRRLTHIEKVVRQIDEDLLPADAKLSYDEYGIHLYIPWGTEHFRLARAAIGTGWTKGNHYTDGSGGTSYGFYKDTPDYYYSLNIYMDPNKLDEGTCKKVLVERKERTYFEDVYKIVCSDGSVLQDVE